MRNGDNVGGLERASPPIGMILWRSAILSAVKSDKVTAINHPAPVGIVAILCQNVKHWCNVVPVLSTNDPAQRPNRKAVDGNG